MQESTRQRHYKHRNHIAEQQVKRRKIIYLKKTSTYRYIHIDKKTLISQPIQIAHNSCKTDLILVLPNTQEKKSIRYYSDIIMSAMASQITGVSVVYSTVCSGAHKKHIKALRHWPLWVEINRWPVNSPHKGPVTRKFFPFDGVVMAIFFNSYSQCN